MKYKLLSGGGGGGAALMKNAYKSESSRGVMGRAQTGWSRPHGDGHSPVTALNGASITQTSVDCTGLESE